ncbi:acetyl-CoA synthetase-like protein [Polychaeton citri CBS 116435]|uniref:Acetyl-CoA synthetase-like protein n=1 Tax=Polychaeton citri CBS 116435 TaxID=1314669 RepID=A0A9P4UUL7_9PEZI|nr:acetyl-CoA synthetase-like protein [Polychaeton citri CBS 116435]
MLTIEEVLDTEKVDSYPWNRSLSEMAQEPFVILHTSGSTGRPKMVEVNHALIATIDAQQDLPDVGGRCVTSRVWKDRPVYVAMPLFHSAGFNMMAFSIFQGTQIVLGPSDAPPSLSTVESILDMDIVSAGLIPPSLLVEVASEPTVLRKLSRWDSVGFGGGPLPEEAGKAIWKHTKILPLLGSTETFNIPELLPQSEDELAYHYYHPSLGIKFEPVSGGLCELVFMRNADSRYQGAFCTFPDLNEYRMKDCYEEHSTKPGLWKYKGRVDDVVVLSNGEKLNPCGAEQILSQHAMVSSVLIVGAGQEQPLLLVEPSADTTSEETLRSSLRDSEEFRLANAVLPAYARIHPTHIQVAQPASFLRSSKGDVRRKPTIDKFEAEIARAYTAAESSIATRSRLDFSSRETLVSSMLSVIGDEILPSPMQRLTASDDMFRCGMDSQGVLRLTRLMRAEMRAEHLKGADQISPRTVYSQRTVANLVEVLQGKDECNEAEPKPESTQQDMLKMLESYLADIPESGGHSIPYTEPSEQVYLLTGSTGSLGSYLLDALLHRHPLAKIICVNRPGGDSSRQSRIQRSRGLPDDLSRVQFLECSMAEDHFGLDDESYQSLQKTTHIIHNAWPVNFNLSLTAFKEQLKACCNMIMLACTADHHMKITFLSSIGAANHWTSSGYCGPVPEAKLDDLDVAEKSGYAQSKLLAEHLFSTASERCQISVTICRVGQIAGPIRSDEGCWNVQEWFPSMLMSSKLMGILPKNLVSMDRVDWIPVDTLADVFMDIIAPDVDLHFDGCGSSPEAFLTMHGSDPALLEASSSVSSAALSVSDETGYITPTSSASSSIAALRKVATSETYLHLVNPYSIGWSDLAPSVVELLGDGVRLVSYEEWVQALATSAEQDGKDLPAAKLIDFFQDIGKDCSDRPVFSTAESTRVSGKLHSLSPVSKQWLERWLHQWSVSLVGKE